MNAVTEPICIRDAAWAVLSKDMSAALMSSDPTAAQVLTPAFNKLSMSVVDVVSDMFAGKDGDKSLAELLGIVAAASLGLEVRARALLWIGSIVKEHADFHADDFAEQWGAQ